MLWSFKTFHGFLGFKKSFFIAYWNLQHFYNIIRKFQLDSSNIQDTTFWNCSIRLPAGLCLSSNVFFSKLCFQDFSKATPPISIKFETGLRDTIYKDSDEGLFSITTIFFAAEILLNYALFLWKPLMILLGVLLSKRMYLFSRVCREWRHNGRVFIFLTPENVHWICIFKIIKNFNQKFHILHEEKTWYYSRLPGWNPLKTAVLFDDQHAFYFIFDQPTRAFFERLTILRNPMRTNFWQSNVYTKLNVCWSR